MPIDLTIVVGKILGKMTRFDDFSYGLVRWNCVEMENFEGFFLSKPFYNGDLWRVMQKKIFNLSNVEKISMKIFVTYSF